jgi:hypothetical protein
MAHRSPRRSVREVATRQGTAIIGGLLIILACAALVWLLLSHFSAARLSPSAQSLTASPTPAAGVLPNNTPVVQIASLAAEGITLKQATHAAALSRQEALLIASQLEPNAASQAKSASAQYLLLDYAGSNSTAVRSSMQNEPSWMIEYQQIPSSTQTPYDLFVFIDANTGKELIAVRV